MSEYLNHLCAFLQGESKEQLEIDIENLMFEDK